MYSKASILITSLFIVILSGCTGEDFPEPRNLPLPDTAGGSAPVADFMANSTSITQGGTVNFTDLSTNTPTSWAWDFGDAGTSTLQNPFYIYATGGIYTVSLTTTNAYGSDINTKNSYITVTSAIVTGTLTDSRDGQVYNTVLIGSQWWMAENLNYGAYVTLATGQGAAGTQKYCYGDNTANCSTYGGLYEWVEMMDGSLTCNGTGAPPNDACATPVQGVCPNGWHIPSNDEWTTLEKNVGSNPGDFPYDLTTIDVWLGTDEGGNLKQTGTTNWTTPNSGATNSSGFAALPGGASWSGSFSSVGDFGYWWCSTEYFGPPNALYRRLYYVSTQVYRNASSEANGYSVRCLQD